MFLVFLEPFRLFAVLIRGSEVEFLDVEGKMGIEKSFPSLPQGLRVHR